jgi:hypothetical protein
MIFDLQKASMWKRVSAFLFDFIILVIAVAGFALLLSTVLGYDKHNAQLGNAYAKYESEYGVVFDISQEEFMQLSQEEQQTWNNAYQALIKDSEAMYSYNMVVNLTLVISSLAILFAYLILEFFKRASKLFRFDCNSAFTGTANSAAPVGVGARLSAT